MDYNDNDYEGQNLHLAGEESSKISVLRPFALPKFDFDDNLHGNLRFDSLVENEVFLGIPSQEDNHWIEDFSRGGNCIEFSSSAGETCALRRHINVWSEATSSESVEMLLKAVGQEERVPRENMIEESDQGNQLDSSSRVVDNKLSDACNADVADDVVPTLSSAEVVGISLSTNQTLGVESDHIECTLQVEETKFSSDIDNKYTSLIVASGNLSIGTKRADNNHGETCGLVDESLSHQMQEDLAFHGKELDNTISSSKNSDVNPRQSVDQDTIRSTNFSSSCTVESTSNPVEKQDEGCNETDAMLSGISLGTDFLDQHCSHETTSRMLYREHEHETDTCIASTLEVSNTHAAEQSGSKDDVCNNVVFVVEPGECIQHGSVSGEEIKHPCGSDSMLNERSCIMPHGEGIDGNDDVPTAGDGSNEMKQGAVTQSPEMHKTFVGNKVSAESNRSLEALSAESEPTMFNEILGIPSEKGHHHKKDAASGDSDKSKSSIVSGECSAKPVADIENAKEIPAPEKENIDDDENVHPPLVGESSWTCKKDIVFIQVDALENNENVYAHEKGNEKLPLGSHETVDDVKKVVGFTGSTGKVEVQKTTESKHDIASVEGNTQKNHLNVCTHEKGIKKLPLDSHEIAFDDVEKVVGFTSSTEGVEVQKATGSKPDSSIERKALNTVVEDTNLPASAVEGVQLVDCREHSTPTSDMVHKDQSRETESEAHKQTIPAVEVEESLDKNELSPAADVKETLDENEFSSAAEVDDAIHGSLAGGIKKSHQSVFLSEASCIRIPDESSKDFGGMIEHHANALVDQDVEAAPSEEQMVAETERINPLNSSKLSVTSTTVGIDKSNNDAVPGASCTDLSQSVVNKQASLKKTNTENCGKILETFQSSGVNEPCKEDETFTFDTKRLGGQSTEDAGKCLHSFSGLQACKMLNCKGFPAVSVSSQTNLIIETSHLGTSSPGICLPSGGVGDLSERKSRRGGNRSGRGSSKKGNIVKETSPMKRIEKGDKLSSFFSPSGTGQLMTFESGVKPKGPVSNCTSSLPDLNTSAPSSSFFQQPFTDMQQLQLRAQIFVYGSLIQGAAPDEACMISAFGMSDGGRSAWEQSWRACAERLHGQKSQGNNTGTPLPSRSDAGSKGPDQTNRPGFPQSEILSSTAGQPNMKAIPSQVNPAVLLSSPLWNISTPSMEALPPGSMPRSAVTDYQAVSPFNSYQTPPIRNYITHSTWPTQATPAAFPVPRLATSQSSHFEISSSYPGFLIAEPVKLTSVKEAASPIPITNSGETAVLPGSSSLDLKKVKASTGLNSDAKSRKRKKSSGSEDVAHIAFTAPLLDTVSAQAVPSQLSNKAPAAEDISRLNFVSQNQVGLMPTPVIGSYYSTSVAISTPSRFAPNAPSNQTFPLVTPSISSGHLSKGDLNMDKRSSNAEGFNQVKEAKSQAQEAAVHAAAAISHFEGVWSLLDLHTSSGLASDGEFKLASAAAAIAAAASVAKAAAAAAKIAADAAVQAKQMADEAFIKPGTSTTAEYDSSFSYNSMNLVNTSSNLMKSGDQNIAPNLMISAAREAAKKRIEAASAATRHAENLDAILKAAELSAEAVVHAGKIVAMGDPFSLSALAEAGPSNYWKLPKGAGVPVSKSSDMNKHNFVSNNAAEVPSIYNQHDRPDKDVGFTYHNKSPTQSELPKDTTDHVTLEEKLTSSVKHGEENSSKPLNDREVSESAKTTFVVSDPDIESRLNISTTSMREGSLVEVLKDRGDLKKAWFSATVLNLKDVEALVCYGVLSDKGSEQLKEWIPLEAKDGDAPRIRVPHSMTYIQLEGTRKRRRAAVKNITWCIGDQVDVWVHDCWREGTIAEKNKRDTTSLSVHFPAEGETLAVNACHLRPSLVWNGGEWTEWIRPGQDCTHQGDTPVEKRPKLGGSSIEEKGKAKMSKEPKLPLSANEKVFSIGSTREDNKLNAVQTQRSVSGKEGSKVVFGVPKPGKKRKFMEVSKHFVSDRMSKTNVPNDLMKLSKFVKPQGSGSRVFRNSSKPDSKEKQVADSRSRPLKSGKPPNVPNKTFAYPDDSTTSSRCNARNTASSDHLAKGSTSNDETESSEQNLAEVHKASRGAMEFASQALPQVNRKKAVRNIKPGHLNQGKLAPASMKSAKDEATEKSISEVAEPRRSNRRIQPTSRLLEGLQSSLIVSKISSSSHNKGTSKGNNTRG